MCELITMCFERAVYADISIRAFAMRDVENADGWGLAWYPDRSLAVAKEPLTWRGSGYAEFLQTYRQLCSPLYVGHVRRKTVGGTPTRADTHPFVRELGGREYCFAHNGTIKTAREDLPSRRYQPIGSTDSEQVFCHLMDRLAERGPVESREDLGWLHGALREINRLGKLNCIFSDGERVVCYHDAGGFKGLWFCAVDHSAAREAHHLDDPTMHVDFETEPANSGVIVATVPLNEEAGWRRFEPGQMMALEAGRVVYAGAVD